ncbi:L-threonylcarbamoyladenylate synthase [Clostridium cavendishii DSM 21758]|uniref:Threonylcarbamoyl-AMP synthase n=1 Tax=Clostridium cavendishii DSM 21758 TaxID=1121302 RepID=A0A1M6U518_9CLOT|nr:L-threonylcarbamoyladenylate synthase [Clostridium cavendishii]SHK64231.1 L-threonylcarbamoyladenylate synthase [Clostridium cavendishii DSM 21758]
METKVFIVEDIEKNLDYIKEGANVIKNGGTVAFPTETVYGLGADALNEEAVKKIFIAKGRPQDNPLIVHVANKEIDYLAKDIPQIAKDLIRDLWPGPLTLILNKKDLVPNVTLANLDTIGIRMPNDPIALKLIEEAKTPIAAPSANISGRPSPTDVFRCVQDLTGRVDCIIGGEKSNVGVESTILDVTCNPPCILRPGGITLEMLKKYNNDIYIDKAVMNKVEGDFKPKAPGMKYRHYAPKAKVRIVSGETKKMVEKINEIVHNYIDAGLKVGIMASYETRECYNKGEVIVLGKREALNTITPNLFESLRALDDLGVDIIISEGFEEVGLGIAIMNRLKKAAAYDIIYV